MKLARRDHLHRKITACFARAVIVAGFLFALLPAPRAVASFPSFGGTNSGSIYYPLNAWSFHDPTNWTSDHGDAPVSFTNLAYSYLGNGSSLVVDSNLPAWLQFNVVETNGATNLTVDTGTVMFWFAPNWSSTNQDGFGPGVLARLFEVGGYTVDSSYGWWSLYVDEVGENIYFSAQTNDLSSNAVTYLSAPIAWTTNYFHHVALTYSPTNTALYLDGALVTNGTPLSVYPGTEVLTNGFFIGSDSNGLNQAGGLFNSVLTFAEPLDSETIQQIFNQQYHAYIISPLNTAMFNNLASANSVPSYTPTYNAVTGHGNLNDLGTITNCVYGTNFFNVWLTNVTAFAAGDGTMTIRFTIGGGVDNVPYDVFANSELSFGASGISWAWEGQGYHCHTYTLSGMPNTAVFIVLGTPTDTDGDGLTDAFENLVSKTNPTIPDTDYDTISDSDEYLLGLNPFSPNAVLPANPNIQMCPQ